MNVFTQIRQMLHEGQEWEARELFFEVALPWLEELRNAVQGLLKEPTPMRDPELLWERIRERYKQEPPPGD